MWPAAFPAGSCRLTRRTVNKCFAFALILATAQAQDNPNRRNPVAEAARVWLQVEAGNLIAAAELMTADKYVWVSSYRAADDVCPPDGAYRRIESNDVLRHRRRCLAQESPRARYG